MIKLSKKLEYALMGIGHFLTHPEGIYNAREICALYQAPFDPMARALQILSQHGHLKSIQGINGGYSMNPSLQNLSLFELQKIIDGESAIVSCLKTEGQCEQLRNCTILQPVQKLEGLLQGFLKDILITDLLTSKSLKKTKTTKGKLAWAR